MDELLKSVTKAFIDQRRKNIYMKRMNEKNELLVQEGKEKLLFLSRYKNKIYRKIHNYKKLSPTQHAEWVRQNSKLNPNYKVYWNGKTSYMCEMP
jgi:hypothetical protein